MPGTATARLEVVSTPPTRAADLFAVQVGAFPSRQEADRLRDQMEHEYGTSFANAIRPGELFVGLQPSEGSTNVLAPQLDKEAGPAFVVADDSQ